MGRRGGGRPYLLRSSPCLQRRQGRLFPFSAVTHFFSKPVTCKQYKYRFLWAVIKETINLDQFPRKR